MVDLFLSPYLFTFLFSSLPSLLSQVFGIFYFVFPLFRLELSVVILIILAHVGLYFARIFRPVEGNTGLALDMQPIRFGFILSKLFDGFVTLTFLAHFIIHSLPHPER